MLLFIKEQAGATTPTVCFYVAISKECAWAQGPILLRLATLNLAYASGSEYPTSYYYENNKAYSIINTVVQVGSTF
jgi:hypothetical protein